jgi:hypothetical protein
MQRECAFRDHPAEMSEVPPEIFGVPAKLFQCDECTEYIVSTDLWELYAVNCEGSISWKMDSTGATLSRLAKRMSDQGCRLELIRDEHVKQGLSEQVSWEQGHPLNE